MMIHCFWFVYFVIFKSLRFTMFHWISLYEKSRIWMSHMEFKFNKNTFLTYVLFLIFFLSLFPFHDRRHSFKSNRPVYLHIVDCCWWHPYQCRSVVVWHTYIPLMLCIFCHLIIWFDLYVFVADWNDSSNFHTQAAEHSIPLYYITMTTSVC